MNFEWEFSKYANLGVYCLKIHHQSISMHLKSPHKIHLSLQLKGAASKAFRLFARDHSEGKRTDRQLKLLKRQEHKQMNMIRRKRAKALEEVLRIPAPKWIPDTANHCSQKAFIILGDEALEHEVKRRVKGSSLNRVKVLSIVGHDNHLLCSKTVKRLGSEPMSTKATEKQRRQEAIESIQAAEIHLVRALSESPDVKVTKPVCEKALILLGDDGLCLASKGIVDLSQITITPKILKRVGMSSSLIPEKAAKIIGECN